MITTCPKCTAGNDIDDFFNNDKIGITCRKCGYNYKVICSVTLFNGEIRTGYKYDENENKEKAFVNLALKLNHKRYRRSDAYPNQVLKVFNRNLGAIVLFEYYIVNNTVYVNDSIMWVTDQRKLKYVLPKGTRIVHKQLDYPDWYSAKRLCDAPDSTREKFWYERKV